MEEVLASAALLVGHLLVRRDDGITDGALGLTLEGANHIPPKGR